MTDASQFEPRPNTVPTHDLAANLGAGSVSPEQFKLAFRGHPAGVALITADSGDGPVALTATSVFSVSVVPPLLVFSISDLSSSTPTIRRAATLVVHLLDADQLHLARLGATSGIDRFADTSMWTRLPTGEPYFPAARTWIRGRIVDTMEAGASTVVVVQALQTNTDQAAAEQAVPGGAPLVYHNRTWHRLDERSQIR